MKTLFVVIKTNDYDKSVCYADYDLEKCKSYCLDMIQEGYFIKDGWDIVGYDLDDDEVYSIYEGYFGLSRNNCRCNFCRHCQINDDYIYVCNRRKHKAISALNPDLESNWIVTDSQVINCKCFKGT